MPNRVLTTTQRSELHYIAVAADLAAAMIRELECLQSNNGPLAFLMGAIGSSAKKRLLSLFRIIEWLTLARNAEEAADRIAQAKTLLLILAGELEQLCQAAGCAFERSAPLWNRFGIASIPTPLRCH
jgi:hypothetical protein